MTRDDIIHVPDKTGPVRMLCAIDHNRLLSSLEKYIDIAQKGIKQQGLRWADDFEGVSDLRYSHANPRKIGEVDFKDWIEGTEYLQELSKSISNIREVGRVRMLMMTPKSTYSLHHDPDLYRVHIPLVTNPDAFLFVNGKMYHLPIGHAYLVQVQYHHLALNAGSENRIHIVFDYCKDLED